MRFLADMSPGTTARIAGVFYLLTFITGVLALVLGGAPGSGEIANLVSTVWYVGVTLLFYNLFKPVNRNISLLAAFFSLLGCADTVLIVFRAGHLHISPLAFFGCYCLTIGYLILRSAFLPHVLGILMAVGGLGWLTFASPTLAHRLLPYNMAPGILGEGALTLWLLFMGVNVLR